LSNAPETRVLQQLSQNENLNRRLYFILVLQWLRCQVGRSEVFSQIWKNECEISRRSDVCFIYFVNFKRCITVYVLDTVEHSARPLSLHYLGGRYSFAVKVARNKRLALVKQIYEGMEGLELNKGMKKVNV